ncbi:hypothetical protein P7C70_g9265, partial [Phenoliferia sp. Uapishka_3]
MVLQNKYKRAASARHQSGAGLTLPVPSDSSQSPKAVASSVFSDKLHWDYEGHDHGDKHSTSEDENEPTRWYRKRIIQSNSDRYLDEEEEDGAADRARHTTKEDLDSEEGGTCGITVRMLQAIELDAFNAKLLASPSSSPGLSDELFGQEDLDDSFGHLLSQRKTPQSRMTRLAPGVGNDSILVNDDGARVKAAKGRAPVALQKTG